MIEQSHVRSSYSDGAEVGRGLQRFEKRGRIAWFSSVFRGMTDQEEGTVDTENEGYVLFANAIHNKHSIQSFVRKKVSHRVFPRNTPPPIAPLPRPQSAFDKDFQGECFGRMAATTSVDLSSSTRAPMVTSTQRAPLPSSYISNMWIFPGVDLDAFWLLVIYSCPQSTG